MYLKSALSCQSRVAYHLDWEKKEVVTILTVSIQVKAHYITGWIKYRATRAAKFANRIQEWLQRQNREVRY